MHLTDLLLAQAHRRLFRRALQVTNKLLRPPRPISVRVMDQRIYAATVDRILALMLAKWGRAERFELDLWVKSIKPGMVIADVGANLGLYTLLAARHTGSTGRVHSFEPDPENFSLLKRNVAENGYGNVTLHPMAVGDTEGKTQLYFCAEHRGDHRIYNTPDGTRSPIDVTLTTLDAALAQSARLDLVKMDIQGSEWRALAGMKQLIKKNPSLSIFLEFWPQGLREGGFDPLDFIKWMKQSGFGIQYINNERAALEEVTDGELLETSQRHGYVNILLRC